MLVKYETMIFACMRQLNIYRDYEQFRQTGRVALWLAWERFEYEKGDFAPFAYRYIRGAMMDEMKRANRFEQRFMPIEDEILTKLIEVDDAGDKRGSERLRYAVESLTEDDRKLLQWLLIMSRERTGVEIEYSGLIYRDIIEDDKKTSFTITIK
ncbi:sigma factor [Sporosarcina thermotolerans]|uniref:sigma factor n=1 Tax=Sporosarcina thermotolerans TaxID=633404 RepID=UPI0036D3EB44